MVLESTEQSPKRWRWRPRKTAAMPEKKVVSKRSTSSSHAEKASVAEKKRKSMLQKEGLTWEQELEAFESSSNKSGFLTLLILVLGLVLIGYGMYQKIHQDELPSQNAASINNTTVIDNTNNTGAVLTGVQKNLTGTKTPLSVNDTNNLIGQYFDLVNKDDATWFAKLQDNSFNTMAALRTYFNSSRLNTFVKNTVDGIRITDLTPVLNDAVLQRNPTAKVYDFGMKYVLKSDGKEYTDAWRGYTVVKWTGDTAITVINGFVYQGNDASTSPFFQFSKYNIK